MSFLEKYTEEEWKIISYLPMGIGYLIGGAGNEQIFGSSSEKMIIPTLLLSAWKEHPDNILIRNIITDPENFQEFMKSMQSYLAYYMFLIEKNNLNSTEGISKIILSDCEKALNYIKYKESQKDIEEYKKWLLDIALKVAHESKEGSFLGFGGERFSKEEKRLYQKLELLLK